MAFPLRPLIHRFRKYLIALAALLVVFTLFGFFGLPPIIRAVAEKNLTQALHRQVSIAEVRFNPFTLAITVRGFKILEPKSTETFVAFDELYANAQITSIFRLAPVIKEIRLTNPYAHLVRKADLTYNVSDLLMSDAPKADAPKKELRFSLNNIRIINGSADFRDEPVQTSHAIRELNVGIPFLSNILAYVKIKVQPELSVKVNGTPYAVTGHTTPFAETRETTVDFRFTDLDIPHYLGYSPVELGFAVPSGRLDMQGTLSFSQPPSGAPTLTVKGELALREFALDDLQKSPLLRLPRLDVVLAQSEPLKKSARFARIAIASPVLSVRRDKAGRINLQALVPASKAAKRDAAPKAEAPAGPETPLLVEVDEFGIAGAKILFSDLATSAPFKAALDPVDVSVTQFSTAKDTQGNFTVAVTTDAKETVQLAGTFSVDPLGVNGEVNVKGVPLKRYAPYYRESVEFDLEDGRLDLSARYAATSKDGSLAAKITQAGVSLRAFRLRDQDQAQNFVEIPSLSVTDTEIDSTGKRIRVGGVSTRGGKLSVVREKGGEVLILRLFRPKRGTDQPAESSATAAGEPWRVELGRLLLEQYTVVTDDRRPSVPTTVLAEQVRLSAENLAVPGKTPGKVALALLLDKAASLSITGNMVVEPLRVEGTIDIKNLPLKPYAPYYQDSILFDILDGRLELATRYSYAANPDQPDMRLTGLALTASSLQLRKRGEEDDFLTIPRAAIANASLDLGRRQISVGDISTEGGSLLVKRYRTGEINLLKLVPSPAGATPGTPQPASGAPGGDQGDAARGGSQPGAPWTVNLGKATVAGYLVQFDDAVPAEPVRLTLEDIGVTAENLSTAEGKTGAASLAFRFGQGTFSTQGGVGIAPVSGDLRVKLNNLDIRPFQPYFTDRIKVALTGGSISADGRIALSMKEPAGLALAYTGDTAVNGFAAVEKATSEDLLRWETLSLRQISAGYNPLHFRAAKVALADFFAKVTMQEGGTLNLQEIMVKEEGAKPAEKAAPAAKPPAPGEAPATSASPGQATTQPMDIQVAELTLQGGDIQFADRSVKPSYSADLAEIGGRVTGLSAAETTLADLELRGKLHNSAPLEIVGKINPLKTDLYVDLRARFTGMDLSPTTPYATKYVGYTISKGKLSFDLNYKIDKRKLDSENKIFVDQLTFGDKVDSPDATSLPVKLAVALLKDRNGQINLDIPVTGSLDDPQFSIWKVVAQIVGNLIVKAVTSPFALLGSAFGGAGEDLQYLEFEPGRTAFTEDSAKKVEALAKGLAEKPGLRLEITGYVDPDPDREGLKRFLMQRKVKAQKLNDLMKSGAASIPVDEVKVELAEYERYLTRAYRAEPFPKPRNFIGMVKSLPIPEMEKLMLTHIEVGNQQLRELAARRANAAREAILKAGVEPDRLFIVEPKSLAPEKNEKFKDSRVEFKIS
jgi:hypothetical protein